jgi:hypothetical protein
MILKLIQIRLNFHHTIKVWLNWIVVNRATLDSFTLIILNIII